MEEAARVLRPGHRIALGPDAYTIIQLNGTAVTLQDQHGELSAVLLGYLLTAPGFQALDVAPPSGRRNFVSEASRRVSVNRPDRPFTPVTALRPGEDVPIDTNKLDIMCRYADGVIRRAELTMAVDVATRSILAGIIAPTTKAVDAGKPTEPAWPNLKRSLANLVKHDISQLTALVKTRLRRMQYQPGLLEGFLAKPRLDLTPLQ